MCRNEKEGERGISEKSNTAYEDSPNGKNLFQAINTWTISVIRYSAAFLNWTKEKTKELDRWTRKQLIAGRALHPKSNVMRIYIKRRYGGR